MRKDMNGKISITRFQGDESGIAIEVQDCLSRIQVIRIKLTPEQFGNAVSGLSYQDCDFNLGSVELVGMKIEHKTELVPFSGYHATLESKKAAAKPFEIDGWKARLDDIGNSHKRVYDKGYNVTFFRHVPNT